MSDRELIKSGYGVVSGNFKLQLLRFSKSSPGLILNRA